MNKGCREPRTRRDVPRLFQEDGNGRPPHKRSYIIDTSWGKTLNGHKNAGYDPNG